MKLKTCPWCETEFRQAAPCQIYCCKKCFDESNKERKNKVAKAKKVSAK